MSTKDPTADTTAQIDLPEHGEPTITNKQRMAIPRQPMPEDKPGVHDESQPAYMRSYYPGRTVILDTDRSVHRDCAYSGWVELDNGDIYVVDYINDDAPLARGQGR